MTWLRQAAWAARSHLLMWIRKPTELLLSLLLAFAYLVIANQVFSFNISDRLTAGLVTDNLAIEEQFITDLETQGFMARRLPDPERARAALAAGEIDALVILEDQELPVTFRLELPGRNLLLDRELAMQLVQEIERISASQFRNVRIEAVRAYHTTAQITAFMTAGMLPFLILALAHTNTGIYWVREWERGTLFSYLATPASRFALVAGRTLSGLVLVIFMLLVSILICRSLVDWPWPSDPVRWLAVVVLQALVGMGLFFFQAAVCRQYRLFVNTSIFLFIILIFISGSYYPVEIMPAWEKVLARLTPTYYMVSSMRAVMFHQELPRNADLAVQAVWGLFFYIAGAWLLIRSRIVGS